MKEFIRPLGSSWRACGGLVVMLAVIAVGTGCAGKREIAVTPSGKQLSQKLTPFLYFEDGKTLFIGVDTRAAESVKQGSIFPLGIALANQSNVPLTLTRESFVLETDSGQSFPLVTVEEYNRQYTRSRSDVRLADSAREALNTRFRNYRYAAHQMDPVNGGGGTSTDSFELGRMHWTFFYVYLPMPEEGIHGEEFNLLVQPREVDETFVVRFAMR